VCVFALTFIILYALHAVLHCLSRQIKFIILANSRVSVFIGLPKKQPGPARKKTARVFKNLTNDTYEFIRLFITSAEEGRYVFGAFCLSVCLSVGLLANLWTDFDEIFCRGRAWSSTKWYNIGGDLDHASDPGVQSPKSGSFVLLSNCVMPCSAEVCALWAYSRLEQIQ